MPRYIEFLTTFLYSPITGCLYDSTTTRACYNWISGNVISLGNLPNISQHHWVDCLHTGLLTFQPHAGGEKEKKEKINGFNFLLFFLCDRKDKNIDKEQNNGAPLSLQTVSWALVYLQGSVSSVAYTTATQTRTQSPGLYLSFSLGESVPSSSSSSLAPMSLCRAKSSKMMSSSLGREKGLQRGLQNQRL